MHILRKTNGLVPILMLLLILPQQARAVNTSWMMPPTGAQYLVIDRNVPNMPIIAFSNWTVLSVNSTHIMIQEDGLLGLIGALGVSLISSGTVSLLQARIVLSAVYNRTSRLCVRPCELLSPREHAWEWIPSSNNATLFGLDFDILSTVFEVVGNATLAPYNRTAWILKPLVDVYSPSVLLYNFWYDQNTGILLRADLFVGGTGNLTVVLENSTANLGVQNLAAPLTPTQLSIIFLSILVSYALVSPRVRVRLTKNRLASSAST
jgi:hypothetical protein